MQLVLLVGTARLLGGLANKLRQPPVVGQIIAGVLIGPSVFGKFYPGTFEWLFSDPTVGSAIYGLAWLAVIMVLVVVGYETDLGIIMRLRRAAVNVSAGALLMPLMVGLVALLTPSSFIGNTGRGLYAAFMALALSVAALPVVAKILLDLGMLRRNFGQVTLAVSMTMDSVGWLILAGLAGIAREGFRPADLLTSLGGLVLFVALAATVGRWALNQAMRLALRNGQNLPAALTVSLVAAIGGGAVTHVLGLEAILGAFIVGIILATLRYQVGAVRHVLETVTDSFSLLSSSPSADFGWTSPCWRAPAPLSGRWYSSCWRSSASRQAGGNDCRASAPKRTQAPKKRPRRSDQIGIGSSAENERGCAISWVSGVLVPVWGSCYKESAGCVVVVVGEPVGDSS